MSQPFAPQPLRPPLAPPPAEAAELCPLRELQERLGLSLSELAAVFWVRQPTIERWLADGVPASRLERVERLLELVRLLDARVAPGLLPQAARRPYAGGRTMLELLVGGQEDRLQLAGGDGPEPALA